MFFNNKNNLNIKINKDLKKIYMPTSNVLLARSIFKRLSIIIVSIFGIKMQAALIYNKEQNFSESQNYCNFNYDQCIFALFMGFIFNLNKFIKTGVF